MNPRFYQMINFIRSLTQKLFTASQFNSEAHYSLKDSPGLVSELFQRLYSFSYRDCKFRHPLMPLPITHKFILMEYSSPNIAKPLHAGHLRSTVIGNVLSNLYASAGHSVVRLNYIGDCGSQFAMIGTSLSDVDVRKLVEAEKAESREIVMWLLQKYIEQAAKLSPKDTSPNREEHSAAKEKVDKWHAQFEANDVHTKQVWQCIRAHSLEDLMATYRRLGVHFDRIEYESDYITHARELGHKLLKESPYGIKTSRPPKSQGIMVSLKGAKPESDEDRNRVFLKSDGSTVYLSRDVSALLSRFESSILHLGRHYDVIHYIVENGQSDHLEAVRKIVCAILPKHRDVLHPELFHVKFGRVHGMSTRKGSAVMLNDILDEASSRMFTILKEKATTKIDKSDNEALAEVSEVLGVTAVVVNDLKRRRQGDYKFNWETALDFSSDGGIALQYTHARLCSIESQVGFVVDNDVTLGIIDLLSSPNACNLMCHMLQFEEVVTGCLESLEAGPFVRYSLKLAKLANQCIEDPGLRVKGQPSIVAQPRVILFKCTRNLLASCLNILGLPALSRI